MQIFINGSKKEIGAGTTLERLMEELNQPSKGVALAVNNQVMGLDSWGAYEIKEQDKLTIIKAVQGG